MLTHLNVCVRVCVCEGGGGGGDVILFYRESQED